MSSDAPATDAKIHLDVLKYIKKIQSRNGVRDNQHIRYRQYCTRRLHRVRVSLALTTKSSKFKSKPLTVEECTNSQHLTIPLLLAERAWAYAMEMQADLEDLEDSAKSRRRYHLVRRLVKAAHSAAEFERICSHVADEVTQLQATAYAAWLKGTVALEKENWADALAGFNSAAAIFQQLASVSDLEMASLCTERSTQIKLYQTFCSNKLKRIDPSAAALLSMQSGVEDAVFQAKLNAVLESSLKSQSTAMQSIEWQGHTYKVKNEKTRVLLVEASSISQQLQTMNTDVVGEDDDDAMLDNDSDMKANDQSQSAVLNKLLNVYDDILITIRADVREVQNAKVKTAVLEEGLQHMQGLQQYVSYLKAQAQLMKNTSTAFVLRTKFHNQSRKQSIQPSSLVTLYDRLLQTVSDLYNSADPEHNSELAQFLDVRKRGFLGIRIFYLGLAYAQNNQVNEAVALMQRSQEYINSTITALKAHQNKKNHSDNPFNVTKDIEVELSQLESVASLLPSELVKTKAKAIAHNETQQALLRSQLDSTNLAAAGVASKAVVHTSTSTPLLNRLEAFDAGISGQQHNLLAFPAPLVAIPAKPFLFDLAANSLEYPDIASRMTNRAGSSQKQPVSSSSSADDTSSDAPQEAKSFWGRLWG